MRLAQIAQLAVLLLPLHAAFADQEDGSTSETSATAESSAGGEGAAAGSKGVVIGFTGLPTVGGFYYLTPVGSLRVDLGFNLELKPDVEAAFSLGAGYRHHLLTGDLRPYVEGGIRFGYVDEIDFALQGGIGVEYFVVPRVSVSGTLGLAVRFDDGGDAISVPFGTTGLLVNMHF